MSPSKEKIEALRQQRRDTGKKLMKSALFLLVFLGFMALFMVPMGMSNAINTMMNTAYRILLDTVFYIMAIAVLAGALSEMLTEFGVLELFNFLLSPLMNPLYGMPGAAALGVVSTYFSDNPSILALAKEQQYRRYFKAYQIPALTNLGTAFGMGLIVTSYSLAQGCCLSSARSYTAPRRWPCPPGRWASSPTRTSNPRRDSCCGC